VRLLWPPKMLVSLPVAQGMASALPILGALILRVRGRVCVGPVQATPQLAADVASCGQAASPNAGAIERSRRIASRSS
jgi:hypothetical protein